MKARALGARFIGFGVLVAAAALAVGPLVWMGLTSLKTEAAISRHRSDRPPDSSPVLWSRGGVFVPVGCSPGTRASP